VFFGRQAAEMSFPEPPDVRHYFIRKFIFHLQTTVRQTEVLDRASAFAYANGKQQFHKEGLCLTR